MKNNTIKKIICYGISIFLVILYASLIYDGINLEDRVSLEYKMFYVDKILKFWPGEDGLSYNLGDILKFGTDIPIEEQVARIGRTGWGCRENGYMVYGEGAKIYFTKIPQKDLILRFKIISLLNAHPIQMFANDTKIGEISSYTNDGWYSFYINKDSIGRDGFLEIEFNSKGMNEVLLEELTIK